MWRHQKKFAVTFWRFKNEKPPLYWYPGLFKSRNLAINHQEKKTQSVWNLAFDFGVILMQPYQLRHQRKYLESGKNTLCSAVQWWGSALGLPELQRTWMQLCAVLFLIRSMSIECAWVANIPTYTRTWITRNPSLHDLLSTCVRRTCPGTVLPVKIVRHYVLGLCTIPR
jgi:hypothetical protein